MSTGIQPYEVLFRYPDIGDTLGTMAWHVILQAPGGTDAFGRAQPAAITEALTPAQAEQLGFSLATLVAGLNADVLKEADALREANAALLSEQSAHEKQIADLAAAGQAAQVVIAERDAEIARLTAATQDALPA